MTLEENMILKFNQYLKSAHIRYIIYADLESLSKKVDGCKNNPEKPCTTKLCEHIPCSYSMSAIWTFDGVENKHDLYRYEYCMKVSP